MQELRSCLRNDSTCGNKLRTMYLTRSGLSRLRVFLLVTNLSVTILKARPHGSFSTSPIKSFQHCSRLFFMPCLRADFTFFHVSCSRKSPFEPVKLVFADSSCVPGGAPSSAAPSSAAPSRIHWVTSFLDAKLNALVVTQGYYNQAIPSDHLPFQDSPPIQTGFCPHGQSSVLE